MSDGGSPVTQRGVCWNTTGNPTLEDSNTINGTGTGAFTSNISGLSLGTTYFVKAYAINSSGTAYGIEYFATRQASAEKIQTPINQRNEENMLLG